MKRLLLATVLIAAPACAKSAATPSAIPVQDTETTGFTFTPNEIVPLGSFTDFTALAADDVARFLGHTPYGTSSFLTTYQSNGLLASAAITRSAETFRINPIVLLVGIEVQGQLVARTAYPQPTSIVDFLFGCGCSGPGVCDPAAAGLDVQVGCYANALRTSLDNIAVNGTTAEGWAPNHATGSLDGTSVTPADASTAALYDFDPIVGSGSSGTSMFANVWALYTTALGYSAPASSTAGATSLVGDPCLAAEDCAIPNAICAAGATYPGGLCTTKCNGTCPTADAFCSTFTVNKVANGYCLAPCSPDDPASCRAGYVCNKITPFGADAASQNVCGPPSGG